MRENTVAEPLSPIEAMFEALHDDAMVCGHEAFGVIEGLQRRGFVVVPAAARRASDAQVAAIADRIDTFCVGCGGQRWYETADPDEFGEPTINHRQEQCLDSIHAAADQVRALAAPAPQPATPLDVEPER